MFISSKAAATAPPSPLQTPGLVNRQTWTTKDDSLPSAFPWRCTSPSVVAQNHIGITCGRLRLGAHPAAGGPNYLLAPPFLHLGLGHYFKANDTPIVLVTSQPLAFLHRKQGFRSFSKNPPRARTHIASAAWNPGVGRIQK